jgi:hypothetical protein
MVDPAAQCPVNLAACGAPANIARRAGRAATANVARPTRRSGAVAIGPGWAEELVRRYSSAGDLVINLDGLPAVAIAAGRLGRRSVNLTGGEAHLNELCLLRETALIATRRALMTVRVARPEKAASLLRDAAVAPSHQATLVVVTNSRADPSQRVDLLPAIHAILRPGGHLAILHLPTHHCPVRTGPKIGSNSGRRTGAGIGARALVPAGTLLTITSRRQIFADEAPTQGAA